MTHVLNFQARFAEDIKSGKKLQTMRPKRKRPIRSGDTLKLYTGLRRKGARLLREVTCKSVDEVRVERSALFLRTSLRTWFTCSESVRESFAIADGFHTWAELWKFFDDQYPTGSALRLGDGIRLRLIRWSALDAETDAGEPVKPFGFVLTSFR